MKLPIQITTAETPSSTDFGLMQTKWASVLNPFISRPQNVSNILPNVAISSGSNVINHLLGRKMQGWRLTDIDTNATLYRSAPLNDKTITLTSSAACNISLEVF